MILLRFVSEPQNLITLVVLVALGLAITACLFATRGYGALSRFLVVRSLLVAVLPALAGMLLAYIGSFGGGDPEGNFIAGIIGFFAGWIGVVVQIVISSVKSFRSQRLKLLTPCEVSSRLPVVGLAVFIPAAIWTGSWLIGWVCPASIVAYRALHGPRELYWLETLAAKGPTAGPELLAAMREYRLSLATRMDRPNPESVVWCFNWLLQTDAPEVAGELKRWLELKNVSHVCLSALVVSASAGRVRDVAPELAALLQVPDTELGTLHVNVLQALTVLGAKRELCEVASNERCDKYARYRAALVLMKLTPGFCTQGIRELAGASTGDDVAMRDSLRKTLDVEDRKRRDLIQRLDSRRRTTAQP